MCRVSGEGGLSCGSQRMAEWVGCSPCGARGQNAQRSPDTGDLDGNWLQQDSVHHTIGMDLGPSLSYFLQKYKGSIDFLCVFVM